MWVASDHLHQLATLDSTLSTVSQITILSFSIHIQYYSSQLTLMNASRTHYYYYYVMSLRPDAVCTMLTVESRVASDI